MEPQTSFAVGTRVMDRKMPRYTGTVVATKGTMFKDTAVQVDWDYGIGLNWELPESLA